ncbi:MAG TPA: TetR/AcrR family transcriptional regulator [Polyangiales bacterium]|nr:TetR/AcrR family transcriptional regulator [Polyangiales bacterium]
MGSPSKKEVTHDRIVATAARAIRRAGFHGVGVADIMKEAGLTHGGFYAHFESRDALLVEALERAAKDGGENLAKGARLRASRGASPFRALVDSYLSDRHLADAELGCPVAALVSEMPRQPPAVRQVGVRRVRAMLTLVSESLSADVGDENVAAIASQLVGALQMARTLGDNSEGKAFLSKIRASLLARYDTSEV